MKNKVTQSKKSPSPKETLNVIFEKASVVNFTPGHKYLMILPKDAKITEIAAALSNFFTGIKIFVLAVNDVTDIKIAELLKDSEDTGVPHQG